MWELDYKESWVPKNWFFWTVELEKTLESPLDCKEIQPVHPKGNQSWIFIRRTDVEAETPILWPPVVKSWLTGKDPGAGKDWRQEEKGTTEDKNIGWHQQLNGHDFEQDPGVGDGQGSLVYCRPWGGKESDTTEWLNWTELIHQLHLNKAMLHVLILFCIPGSFYKNLKNIEINLIPPKQTKQGKISNKLVYMALGGNGSYSLLWSVYIYAHLTTADAWLSCSCL